MSSYIRARRRGFVGVTLLRALLDFTRASTQSVTSNVSYGEAQGEKAS